MRYERDLIHLAGKEVPVEEASNEIFESHLTSASSILEFNAAGSPGWPVSAEPFLDSGD
jgi:hypothetical protein